MLNTFIPIMGIDIGGTMSKASFALHKNTPLPEGINHIPRLTITTFPQFDIYFSHSPSSKIHELISLIEEIQKHCTLVEVHITGGGAYKYYDTIVGSLNVSVVKVGEFESLSHGFDFLNHLQPNDSFYIHEHNANQYLSISNSIYPFLLVNIGSGVSILRFESATDVQRIGGTSLGGGMFLGLCNTLTGINDYDKLLEMSHDGKNSNDLLLREVQKKNSFDFDGAQIVEGTTTETDSPSPVLLSETLVAVSLGKLDNSTPRPQDLVKSLLYLTTYNLSQIAHMYSRLQKVQRVFFSGYFIRGHGDTIQCITNAFDYFSKMDGEHRQVVYIHLYTKPYFVKHDGFIGSLGAMAVAYDKYKQKQE